MPRLINMKYRNNGFTLIEVMVSVAIIGFLAVTGWRVYDEHKTKVVRADAVAALTIEANNMEKCGAAQGNTYIGCILGSNTSPNNHYRLALNNQTATTYTIIAERLVDNPDDTMCTVGGRNYDLAINELGQTGIRQKGTVVDPVFGNTQQIRRCWNK